MVFFVQPLYEIRQVLGLDDDEVAVNVGQVAVLINTHVLPLGITKYTQPRH
jgi:hypothetical protein